MPRWSPAATILAGLGPDTQKIPGAYATYYYYYNYYCYADFQLSRMATVQQMPNMHVFWKAIAAFLLSWQSSKNGTGTALLADLPTCQCGRSCDDTM